MTGLVTAFGSGAMTNSTPEIEEATCVFVIGSNTTEQHPLVATRIYRAIEKGAGLIVADPREIQISLFAHVHLRHRPGTDVALLNGMMHVILEEGLEDKAFIAERTEGFEELKRVIATYTPQRVEAITGVPAEQIVEAARLYGQAGRASLIYAMGITQHTTGVDNVLSCANLAMLTGNVGRPSTGVNPLRGQNNVQGACDMGSLPNVYPGYQRVDDQAVRDRFEEAWGTSLPDRPGLSVMEMTDAAYEGEIKAMYVVAENPMLSDPDINHVRHALEALEFLVVQDIFLTETAEFADVVLPGVSFAEKDGTYTATDRRVQRVRQAIPPLGGARQDWGIVCELAKRIKGSEGPEGTPSAPSDASAPFSNWDYSSPAEIMAEIARLTPIYGGISYERLDQGGLLWPCRTAQDPGTPYLHKGQFSRGLGRFSPVEFKEAVELPDEEYPLILTTGRIMFQYHTGTMTRRSPKLEKEVPEGYVEINPADARSLSIAQGERVRVISRRGEIEIATRITPRVDRGVVFIPFHFAEAAANVLTIAALDPVAKIPEYKVCAVRVERAAREGNRGQDRH